MDEVNEPDERFSTLKVVGLVAGLVLVCAIWFASYFIIQRLTESPELAGQVGDSFGAVNSLFSGLALFGVVVAIVLQGMELKLQRKELRDTRRELARAAEAQQKSEISLKNQAEMLKLAARASALTGLLAYRSRDNTEIGMLIFAALSEDYANELEDVLRSLRPADWDGDQSVRQTVDHGKTRLRLRYESSAQPPRFYLQNRSQSRVRSVQIEPLTWQNLMLTFGPIDELEVAADVEVNAMVRKTDGEGTSVLGSNPEAFFDPIQASNERGENFQSTHSRPGFSTVTEICFRDLLNEEHRELLEIAYELNADFQFVTRVFHPPRPKAESVHAPETNTEP